MLNSSLIVLLRLKYDYFSHNCNNVPKKVGNKFLGIVNNIRITIGIILFTLNK